ncbi:sensor histidine kinase [Cohnella zeiphila]|uniref:histidine kinase n=1 Tax=Cohnella zeiphila TaxID=2761120 RepID=A0A7X0SR96_9BACL|nr:sensor histidine kinase [Cohnella zeiphila]MBB6734599.1 sensor histidine kinase [Cohnella zeiphila]
MRKWLMLAPLVVPFVYVFLIPLRPAWPELALFAAFVAAYRQSHIAAKGREWSIAAQIAALFFMGVLESPWLLSLGLYPAICMSLLPSYRRIAGMAGTMAACFCGSILWFGERASVPWSYAWLPLIAAVAILPFYLRMYRRSCELKGELRDANAEIARMVKNEERRRIARDLHDTLGHQLSLIALKSELAEKLAAREPDQAAEEARDVQRITRATLLQVRELVSDMQAIDIEEEFRQAEGILRSAGISFEGALGSPLKTVPVVRNILGMCLRECVTNVVRHSGADRCEVFLREEPGSYVLSVQDNGGGMASDRGRLERFGNGLLGMKERLLLIEGKLDWNSDRARGTNVTITVPRIGKPNAMEGAG